MPDATRPAADPGDAEMTPVRKGDRVRYTRHYMTRFQTPRWQGERIGVVARVLRSGTVAVQWPGRKTIDYVGTDYVEAVPPVCPAEACENDTMSL